MPVSRVGQVVAQGQTGIFKSLGELFLCFFGFFWLVFGVVLFVLLVFLVSFWCFFTCFVGVFGQFFCFWSFWCFYYCFFLVLFVSFCGEHVQTNMRQEERALACWSCTVIYILLQLELFGRRFVWLVFWVPIAKEAISAITQKDAKTCSQDKVLLQAKFDEANVPI